MAQRRKQKGGISWELLGIVAVLAVFLVGFIFWAALPEDRIVDPDFSSLDPTFKGEGEPAATIATGIDDDGRAYLGDPTAPVTFYEFADFQCPHCREFTTGVAKDIKADYLATGRAKMVWVNTAFLGAESEDAAIAAYCAGEQGQFWPFHDYLFKNQPALYNQGGFSRDRLLEMADRVGIDRATFQDCLGDPAMIDRLKADRELASESGIDSTPSFLIGDQVVVGSDGLKLRETLDAAE